MMTITRTRSRLQTAMPLARAISGWRVWRPTANTPSCRTEAGEGDVHVRPPLVRCRCQGNVEEASMTLVGAG